MKEKKKSNMRIVLQKGRETWRKERRERERERERERSMGRGETWVNVSEGVRRKKVRKLTVRERMHQKIMFLAATDKDNIYKKCNAWERDYFQETQWHGLHLHWYPPYIMQELKIVFVRCSQLFSNKIRAWISNREMLQNVLAI